MSLSQVTEQPARRLGDAKAVGRVLDVSWRTVYRLADAGKIPSTLELSSNSQLPQSPVKPMVHVHPFPVPRAKPQPPPVPEKPKNLQAARLKPIEILCLTFQ